MVFGGLFDGGSIGRWEPGGRKKYMRRSALSIVGYA
jgi:hypothetical protein